MQRSTRMELHKQEGHSQDIIKYLSSELRGLPEEQAEDIKQEIHDRASGIFMWVVLVVQILNKLFDHGQGRLLRQKLREIPDDLHELFRSILTRDTENMDEMKLCLQLVLFARRPLKREELYFGIWIGLRSHKTFPFDPHHDLPESMDKFILSSSKGLAEVTGTSDRTVQFIHESVRDYLLQAGGLGQVWPDLIPNAGGLSHDKLKEICWDHIKACTDGDIDINRSLPKAKSDEATILREETLGTFPFLQYATVNVFGHADDAHASGVAQDAFVFKLEIAPWVYLNNLIEPHNIRRLPPNIDLTYMFVQKKHYNLLTVMPQGQIDARSGQGRHGNPIFAAIADNDLQAFEALTRSDRESMAPTPFPYTGHNIPAFLNKYAKPELLQRLLTVYDIDLSARTKGHETLLMRACRQGSEANVRLLISRGANVNETCDVNQNALGVAVESDNKHIVELLLENGTDLNIFRGNSSALVEAVKSNNKQMVELLLKKGANINPDNYQCVALARAVENDNEQIVELLLEKGASVEAGSDSDSPLAWAVRKNNARIVRLLFERGARVSSQGFLSARILWYAIRNDNEEIVKLLLEMGADVYAECYAYDNALVRANDLGNWQILRLLLEYGTPRWFNRPAEEPIIID